jgi:hypothetical protein
MTDVRFIFARDENNFPIGCFAYRRDKEELTFGYSVYNFADRFDRSRARDVASARLNKKPCVVRGSDSDSTDILIAKAMRATDYVGVSQWAKEYMTPEQEKSMPVGGFVDWSTDSDNKWFRFRELGNRFCSACIRTATKLESVAERSNAA